MNKTYIEWVKNPDGSQGYTWNPITGCLNHVNGKCKGGGFPCYAYRLANGRLRERYLANNNLPCSDKSDWADPFYPRFWPERFKELVPIGGLVCELVYPPKTRRGIFVCDMSDLFGIGIPDEWIEAILNLIKKWPAHRFYLLTKQPQNLIKFSPFPENCWVGVTATNYTMANQARYWLGQIEAKVKYLSIEPFLEPLNDRHGCLFQPGYHINWVIIGAQTKPTVTPKIEWVQEIVGACDKARIPVFIKNNLAPYAKNIALYPNMKFGDKGYDLLRQELPNGKV